MVAVLLIGGVGLLLGGLLTAGLGIQLDLSFGNTLILAGAIVACTGVIMLGLWIALRELKALARQLGPGMPAQSRAASMPGDLSASTGDQALEDGGFLFSRDQPALENPDNAESAAQSASPRPWHAEAASRDRAPAAPEAAAAVKPRRNLVFSSSSRKERERALARAIDPSALDIPPILPAALAAEPGEPPPASFDDAWPKPERARTADAPLPRRSSRASSSLSEPGAAAAGANPYSPAAARPEDPPQVTVLKSGVVDGMAYSLYSDGSIEAQMPEGMMRFASIDELRAHLDQRP
jgi:hypothetical protein